MFTLYFIPFIVHSFDLSQFDGIFVQLDELNEVLHSAAKYVSVTLTGIFG